jgi:nucleotidyltransferase/DNA polymerase involved in DNA repair
MLAHVDADCFFVSVLQRKHPKLKGKPILAMGMGGGCVIAASYEAKAKGVKTGMPYKQAMELCPEAINVPADFAETALASHQIEAILQGHCPVMEQYSIDEWFMDLATLVGGVPFDLLLWAKDVQKEILMMTDLSVSIGIGPSKILAKMAGEEHKPAGCTVVEKHQIEAFLGRRPAAAIPGIGRRRDVHAKAKNWTTAWDIANADAGLLQQMFGKPGVDLKRELLGERLSEVATEGAPPKSISRTRTFKATKDPKMIWAYALQHLSYTVLKMRNQDLSCRGISLWLRDNRYHHDGIQLRLPRPMDTEEDITPFARKAFDRLRDHNLLYNQVGFCLWNLSPKGSEQFSLFESPKHAMEDEDLQQSLDNLRKKFGREVVIRGSQLPVHNPERRKIDLSIVGDN